jgi:hypothetical protein
VEVEWQSKIDADCLGFTIGAAIAPLWCYESTKLVGSELARVLGVKLHLAARTASGFFSLEEFRNASI